MRREEERGRTSEREEGEQVKNLSERQTRRGNQQKEIEEEKESPLPHHSPNLLLLASVAFMGLVVTLLAEVWSWVVSETICDLMFHDFPLAERNKRSKYNP